MGKSYVSQQRDALPYGPQTDGRNFADLARLIGCTMLYTMHQGLSGIISELGVFPAFAPVAHFTQGPSLMIFRYFRFMAAAVCLTILSPGTGVAQEATKGDLHITQGQLRVILKSRPAAGFLSIANKGSEPDRLVAAETDEARRIELHGHSIENGIMKMRALDAIDIPANGSAELKTGGYHLMVFGLKHASRPGDTLAVTLVFERNGRVDVTLPVTKPGDGMNMQGHGTHGHSKDEGHTGHTSGD